MSAEWPRVTIRSLIENGTIKIQKDGNHGSKYPRAAEFGDEGVPFLTAKLLDDAGNIDLDAAPRLDEEKANKFTFGFIESGDVLLSHNATVGRVAIVPELQERVLIGTSLTHYRLDTTRLLPRYLAAFFSGRDFQNQLAAVMSQTTRNQVPITSQRTLSIVLPPLDEQENIASTLGTLDSKIRNNHQINQTLEQMAQAIFKSWFVDFEPVKAKIAARQHYLQEHPDVTEEEILAATDRDVGSAGYAGAIASELAAMRVISGRFLPDADASAAGAPDPLAQMAAEQPEQYAELQATAALFPAALQESELGETNSSGTNLDAQGAPAGGGPGAGRLIPEGWEVSQIGDEVTVVGGGTPSTKNPDFWEGGDIHWTTPKDLSSLNDKVLIDTERKITPVGLAKISSGLLPVDTVLMSSRAPVGYLALAKTPVAVNQGYIAMKCDKRLTPEYVLQWCESRMDEIKGRASGTTFAEISKKNFKAIPAVVPAPDVIELYSAKVSGLYLQIESLVRQSRILSEMRDTLLPKLLSGELTLPEAQTQLQDVAHV
ncbi:restriction endonuclease subunit S [Aestuariirhabdus sp. LZHN29]|uniref:restriction endonuclease subunit S n=1 Tax=Aestuariirhabdus sp. LZHN29 TaxID=3417462 RepID=UPI003CF7DEAB